MTKKVLIIAMIIVTGIYIIPVQGQPCEQSWMLAADVPLDLWRGAAYYYKGNVIIATGTTATGYLNKALYYNIAEDTWIEGPEYDPTGWTNACAAVVNGEIHFLGGYQKVAEENVVLNKHISFNLEEESWSEEEALPYNVAGAFCAAVDDLIYLAGGADNNGGLLKHIAYNPETKTWSDDPVDWIYNSRFGLSASDGEKWYAFSGSIGSTGIKNCREYDLEENTWSELSEMASYRMSPGGGFADGLIYVFSGGGRNSSIWMPHLTSEIYNIATGEWSIFTPDIIYPMTASASVYIPEGGGLWIIFGGSDGLHSCNYTRILALCRATLEGIFPDRGENGEDVEVEITGTGFEADDIAYLENSDVRIDFIEQEVINDRTMSAKVPSGSVAGIYSLVLESTSGEDSTLENAYEVLSTGDDDNVDDDDDSTDDDDDNDDENDNDSESDGCCS